MPLSKKTGKALPAKPMPKPYDQMAKKSVAQVQPPEIGFGAADEFGGAMAAHDGNGKQNGCQQRRKHGANVNESRAGSRSVKWFSSVNAEDSIRESTNLFPGLLLSVKRSS